MAVYCLFTMLLRRKLETGRCDVKVALVTGASRGIGKVIARRLASEGAAVIVNSPVLGEEEGLPGTLEGAA